jgi:hypothetical protein
MAPSIPSGWPYKEQVMEEFEHLKAKEVEDLATKKSERNARKVRGAPAQMCGGGTDAVGASGAWTAAPTCIANTGIPPLVRTTSPHLLSRCQMSRGLVKPGGLMDRPNGMPTT